MDTMNTQYLKAHPLNATLYEAINQDSPQFKKLKESVARQGILEPIVIRPDGTILSGHRRHSVALDLALMKVPVTIREGGDDRLLLVEFNRQRIKTISETMREAELIETVVAEHNKARMVAASEGRSALASMRDIQEPEHLGRTSEVVSTTVGMKSRTYVKARTIYEEAKTNENAKEKLARVDAGEMSIDAAYKSLRKLRARDEAPSDIPDFIRFYTSWQFAENDPRFGIPHPGRIPGQISANIIYYFTQPGDLVVDPMAGGGSTIDAGELLDRRVLGYDVIPRRHDIKEWDISKGFPKEAQDCQLIFMDPPYWNMKDEGYGDLSSSRLSLEEFYSWYEYLMQNAAKTVRIGGFVAVINMSQFFRLPDDFEEGYIDWPIRTWQYLRQAGLTPWSRITVTYPTTLFTGFDVEAAKAGKFLLPNVGDIIVMRKVLE